MVMVTVAMLLIRPWFQEKGRRRRRKPKSATKSKEEKDFVATKTLSELLRDAPPFLLRLLLLNLTPALSSSFPIF